MSKNKESLIIKGYKGIMDLDLRNVDKELHETLIQQHYQDIKLYKKEQTERPKHLRYENTILRIEKIHRIDYEANLKRKEEQKQKQFEEDKRRIEIYYNSINK